MLELSSKMAGITALMAACNHAFVVWKVYQVFNDEDTMALFGVFVSESDSEDRFKAVPHTMLTSLLSILVNSNVLNYAGEWEDANT